MLVEVWQDTVCPWCRIGERHLKLALAQWRGEPVEVRYRSFFLDPEIPVEGRDFVAAMARKGGGRAPLEAFFAEPRRRGAAVGLTFNFERIEWMPNTMLSHRLVALTPEDQRENMLEEIYGAFFERGEDIGSSAVLARVAASCRLDPAWVESALAGDAGREAVLADVRQATEYGITGVPFFVFGGRYALSGAQPPEMILNALERAAVDARR